MLSDSFAAKSKFLFFEHRHNGVHTGEYWGYAYSTVQYSLHFHPIQSKSHPVAHHHLFSLKQKLDFFQLRRYISVLPFYNAVCDMHIRGNCGVSRCLFGFPPERRDTTVRSGKYGISSRVWDERWKTSHQLHMGLLHKPLPKRDLLAPVVEKGRFGRGRITGVQR